MLVGAYAVRNERARLVSVWGQSLCLTGTALTMLLPVAYWGLRAAQFLFSPMWHMTLGRLASFLDTTGLLTYCFHQLTSATPSNSHLVSHPFAVLASAVILSFYMAVSGLWMEKAAASSSTNSSSLSTRRTQTRRGKTLCSCS